MIVLDRQTSGGLAAFTGSRGGGRGESITPPPRGGGGQTRVCVWARDDSNRSRKSSRPPLCALHRAGRVLSGLAVQTAAGVAPECNNTRPFDILENNDCDYPIRRRLNCFFL